MPASVYDVDEARVEAKGQRLDGRALAGQSEVLHLLGFEAEVRFLLSQNFPQDHSERENIGLLVSHAPPVQRGHRGLHAMESRGRTPEQLWRHPGRRAHQLAAPLLPHYSQPKVSDP